LSYPGTEPKAPANFFQHGRSAAILDYIMKERSDGEILIPARLEHQGCNPHQVRDVGNGRGFARLALMLFRSK